MRLKPLDPLQNEYGAQNRGITPDEKRSVLRVREHHSPSLTTSLGARRPFAAGLLTLMLLAPTLSGAHEMLLEPTSKDTAFRFDPRIEVIAHIEPTTSTTGIGTGTLHALVPMSQSEDASDLWFGHAQAHYRGSTETQYLEASFGLGAGYRMQLDSEMQIGAYGLLDLRLGATKEKYYLFTPGVEVQTSLWRLSLNGYLPMGKSASVESETKWGHELGDGTYHYFKGNDEFDHLHQTYQKTETLPMGVDLNGSWHFNEQLSLSVGGYYMKYGEEARPGARIGLAYALTPNFQLTLQGQKDTQEAQLSLQFRTSLGSTPNNTNRLMSPIHRPLIPMTIIEDKTPVDLGLGDQKVHPFVEFHTSGGTGSGTFENPKGTVLSQAEVNELTDGAVIYLAPGRYTLQEETGAVATNASWKTWFASWTGSTPTISTVPLILNNKSIMGRTDDFKAPKDASDLLMPLKITGKASVEYPIRIEHISLRNAIDNTIKIWPYGMLFDEAEHVQVKNVKIVGAVSNRVVGYISDGIQIKNSRDIATLNSLITYTTDKIVALENSSKVYLLQNDCRLLYFGRSPAIGISSVDGEAIKVEQNTITLYKNNYDHPSWYHIKTINTPTFQQEGNDFKIDSDWVSGILEIQ